jgi:hypothetical protein
MHFDHTFQKYFFLICIVLATTHAFLMNGHRHLHQLLTVGTYIDPIVAKADPSLFKNSIYVQAMNRTCVKLWPFHDLYGYIMKNYDFENFSLALAVISLFCTLSGIFTLSRVLFKSTETGFVAMLLYTAALQSWTLGYPGPYLNFFHPGLPYAQPLLVWSMVFFFQKRFFFALLLAGISFNFHAMSTLYLLITYVIYCIFRWEEFKFGTILYCLFGFIFPAFPAIIKTATFSQTIPQPDEVWLQVIKLTAWYQCFPATWPIEWKLRAGFFFFLCCICLFQIKKIEVKKNILIFYFSVALMCLIGTVFSDLYPVPFIIKISFWRSTTIYLLLALPCITYTLLQLLNKSFTRSFIAIALMVLITGYLQSFKLYYLPFLSFFLLFALYENQLATWFPFLTGKFQFLFFSLLFPVLYYQITHGQEGIVVLLLFAYIIMFLLIANLLEKYFKLFALLQRFKVMPILFVLIFDLCILGFRGGPEIYYHGSVTGKADPWADIQVFANKHSHKDDIFITPPYIGGFGMYSMRATLGDWAEWGPVLYSDNQYARECLERMNDLGWRKYYLGKDAYNKLTKEQMLNIAKKYKAKFVVTEKPKTFDIEKIYENSRFILYRVPLPEKNKSALPDTRCSITPREMLIEHM